MQPRECRIWPLGTTDRGVGGRRVVLHAGCPVGSGLLPAATCPGSTSGRICSSRSFTRTWCRYVGKALAWPVRAGGEPLAGISLPMSQARVEHLIGFPRRGRSFVDGALRPLLVSLDLGRRTRRRAAVTAAWLAPVMRIPLWQLARFCDRAPALPGLTVPCRRGGRGTFRESSLMVLVLVGAPGEAGKAGVLPRPAQGGRRGSGFQFGAWALV